MYYVLVEVNIEYEGDIFFLVVCCGGFIDVVEELIKVGVDVNLKVGDVILLIIVCYKGILILV